MSDPAKYRTKDEVDLMKTEHDSIETLKKRLVEEGHMTEDAMKDLDREVREIASRAAEFAQNAPEPDAAELWTEVLVEG